MFNKKISMSKCLARLAETYRAYTKLSKFISYRLYTNIYFIITLIIQVVDGIQEDKVNTVYNELCYNRSHL